MEEFQFLKDVEFIDVHNCPDLIKQYGIKGDFGADDAAKIVAGEVGKNPFVDKGIVICASGLGVQIYTNTHDYVLGSIAGSAAQVKRMVGIVGMDILCLPDLKSLKNWKCIVKTFLKTKIKPNDKDMLEKNARLIEAGGRKPFNPKKTKFKSAD